MTVYQDTERHYTEPRHHPWTVGEDDVSFRYVDFKAHPEKIEDSLEDFKPFARQNAVQRFYSFLRWINGPDSELETDDCAFRPPRTHQDPNSRKKLACHGRVFLLFRTIAFNLSPEASRWLNGSFHYVLSQLDPQFAADSGVIGATKQKAFYSDLPHRSLTEVLGGQLMLSFWAYGDTEDEVFANLDRLFKNLFDAAVANSEHIRTNKHLFDAELEKNGRNPDGPVGMHWHKRIDDES